MVWVILPRPILINDRVLDNFRANRQKYLELKQET
jgi:hypothetical protein